MDRPVQLGDRVYLSDGDTSSIYSITHIDGNKIYVASDREILLITPDLYNEYRVYKAHPNYEFRFIPSETSSVPVLNVEFLSGLDDETLEVLCQTNQQVSNLCQGIDLWYAKLRDKYSKEVVDAIPKYEHPRNACYELKRIDRADDPTEMAIKKNSPYLLKHVEDKYYLVPDKDYVEIAAKNNSLNGLKWLIDSEYPIDFTTVNRYGTPEMVEFLYPMFPNYNIDDNFDFIIVNGNLDVLKWWAEPPRNVLPDSTKYPAVFINNHYHIINWMEEMGIELDQVAVNDLVYSGIPALEWAETRGWLPEEYGADRLLDDAVYDESPDLQVLDWLAERRIFPSDEGIRDVKENVNALGGPIVMEWLEDQNLV